MRRAWIAVTLAVSAGSGCSTIRKPFYYEIQRDGQTHHALGTIHLGVESSDLPGFVREDFERSRTFVSEITPDFFKNGKLRQKDKGWYARDFEDRIRKRRRLSEKLSAAAWGKLKPIVEAKLPADSRALADFLPPALAYGIAFSEPSDEQVEVTRGEYYALRDGRLDFELYADSIKAGQFQIALDDSAQVNACLETLEIDALEEALTLGRQPTMTRLMNLVRAYRAGDETELLASGSRATAPATASSCLLEDRNRHWAQAFEHMDSSRGPYFVAVGARHLVGPGNLLKMLEARGYSVRRVTGRD